MAHTILLVQPGKKPEGRTYSDYESVNECLEGTCKIFEEYLKKINPNSPSITYDISQLFDFIDQLADLSCLVFDKSSGKYIPHNKSWIKEKIYILLRQQAGKSWDIGMSWAGKSWGDMSQVLCGLYRRVSPHTHIQYNLHCTDYAD